jgi:hypothetical protein
MSSKIALVDICAGLTISSVTSIARARERAIVVLACSAGRTVVNVQVTLVDVLAGDASAAETSIARACERTNGVGAGSVVVAGIGT